MIAINQVATATLDQLTDELAAACWDSTETNICEARSAVARLLNEYSDLRLYDSETGELITSEVTDELVEQSVLSVEGHIMVDGRKCYVSE